MSSAGRHASLKGNLLRATGFLAWFIILPYAVRLPWGLDWAAQYLPDDGKLLLGLIFFSAFNSLPGWVMILAPGKLLNIPTGAMWFNFTLMSLVTGLSHFSYDLASDAQAAIWLVVAPVFTAMIGTASLLLLTAAAWAYRRFLRSPP